MEFRSPLLRQPRGRNLAFAALVGAVVAATSLFGVSGPVRAAEDAPPAASNAAALTNASRYLNDVIAPHKGKAVVVNFWAMWCVPCVRELPELQEASATLAKENIDVVLVSADGKDAAAERVPAFLAKKGVTLPVFVSEDVDPELMINVVDPEWNGTLPFTVVYDASGRRVKTLLGAQSKEKFIAAARAVTSTPPAASLAKTAKKKAGAK